MTWVALCHDIQSTIDYDAKNHAVNVIVVNMFLQTKIALMLMALIMCIKSWL